MGIKLNSKKGSYEVSYSKRHPVKRTPRRRYRTLNDKGDPIKSKAEAQRMYDEMVVQLNSSFKAETTPTWAEMIDRSGKASLERGLQQGTIEDYRLGLNAYTMQPWGARLIDSISTEEIRKLITEKVNHRSANQQKNILKFIRSVFSYAVESGALQRNPTPTMKFRVGDKIKAVLTEPQIKILLERSKEYDHEWYYHWCLALYTGMRNGELYTLTWDKVDLNCRMIKVDCSWTKRDGFKDYTKSGDDRIVEIAPTLLSVLSELKLRYAESHYVLPRLDKWDKGEQARELRMFLLGLRLPQVRFHDLRASWATVLLGKGIPPAKVMLMGGWKDMKTMMIYLRKAGIDIRGITDDLDLHNPSTSPAKLIYAELGAKL